MRASETSRVTSSAPAPVPLPDIEAARPVDHPRTVLRVVPVGWHHPDAVSLRAAMVAEIQQRYADRIGDPKQRSPQTPVDVEKVAYTALAYLDGVPVGHVALRHHLGDLELKRMYVVPAARGTGAAAALLSAAESAARATGAARVVLHTGDRQPEAVRLYRRHGYRPIPVYPPYDTIPGSLCFAKPVTADALESQRPSAPLAPSSTPE